MITSLQAHFKQQDMRLRTIIHANMHTTMSIVNNGEHKLLQGRGQVRIESVSIVNTVWICTHQDHSQCSRQSYQHSAILLKSPLHLCRCHSHWQHLLSPYQTVLHWCSCCLCTVQLWRPSWSQLAARWRGRKRGSHISAVFGWSSHCSPLVNVTISGTCRAVCVVTLLPQVQLRPQWEKWELSKPCRCGGLKNLYSRHVKVNQILGHCNQVNAALCMY